MYSTNQIDAPRYKGLQIPEDAEIVPFRDTQTIASDASAYSGAKISFFPPTASQSNVDSNYEKNPLPKNRAYDILGIGLGWEWGILRVEPGSQGTLPAGLDRTINGLTHSRLLFETSTKTELIDQHLKAVGAVEGIYYDLSPTDQGGTGDGFLRDVCAPSTLTTRKADPIHVEPQETFEMELEFHDPGAWLPTESEWTSALSGKSVAPQAVATLLVAYR